MRGPMGGPKRTNLHHLLNKILELGKVSITARHEVRGDGFMEHV